MPAKAVPAPESAIKRAQFKVQLSESFKKARAAHNAELKAVKKAAWERGLKYARMNRSEQSRLTNLRRQAKSHGNFYLEASPKIAVVVRIRGIANVAPKQRKVLQLLRLRQIFNCVVVKLNKPIQNMLRMVEPLIAYGYPSTQTIRGLLYKRGHLKINRQRVKITDNLQIKEAFKNEDLVCIEDLVHQIQTCGKHFRTVTNKLWPFKLSPPCGGMKQKRRHFVEGGDFGNRENLINKFLYRMI